MKRARPVKLLVSVFAVSCLASIGSDVLIAQDAEPVTMPPGGAVLRISLGLTDKVPTDWNGRVEVSQGKALDVAVQPARLGESTGISWIAKSRPPVKAKQKSVHDPKAPKLERPTLLATVDASPASKVSVTTDRGSFTFVLGDLQQGTPQAFLDGQARVELLPLTVQITNRPGDEDLPAAARDADGNV